MHTAATLRCRRLWAGVPFLVLAPQRGDRCMGNGLGLGPVKIFLTPTSLPQTARDVSRRPSRRREHGRARSACSLFASAAHVCLEAYCIGLLLRSERKSVEPMAAVTAPERVSVQHQSMLHFISQGGWSHEKVLGKVRTMVVPEMERPITSASRHRTANAARQEAGNWQLLLLSAIALSVSFSPAQPV